MLQANTLVPVFHLASPQAKFYPQIVYSVISDVPMPTADNMERGRRVTVRFHILTVTGRYDGLYEIMQRVMKTLGFMRVQTVEQLEDGLKIKTVDYRIGVMES